VSLPAADDLFRPTADPGPDPAPGESAGGRAPAAEADAAHDATRDAASGAGATRRSTGARRASGRVRHDEKMTVYTTAEELLELEQARLRLRGEHGLAVDRGRLVRAAIALALAELDERGAESELVQRLRESGT